MIAHGCTLSVPEIDKQLKDYVFKAEVERLPWIPGVQDVLHSLKEATSHPCWSLLRLAAWPRTS